MMQDQLKLPEQVPFSIWQHFQLQEEEEPKPAISEIQSCIERRMGQFKIWKQGQKHEFGVPKSQFFKDKQERVLEYVQAQFRHEQMQVGPLDQSMLASIRQTGTFQVKSQSFDMPYKWKLHRMLVKGSSHYLEDYKSNMSFALSLWMHCPYGHNYMSIPKKCLKTLTNEIYQFVKVCVGLKSVYLQTKPKQVEYERQCQLYRSGIRERVRTALFSHIYVPLKESKKESKVSLRRRQELSKIQVGNIGKIKPPQLAAHIQILYNFTADLDRAKQNYELKVVEDLESFQKTLQAQHPYRSGVQYWMRRQLKQAEQNIRTHQQINYKAQLDSIVHNLPQQEKQLFDLSTKIIGEKDVKQQTEEPLHREYINTMVMPPYRVVRYENELGQRYFQLQKTRCKVICSDETGWVLKILLFKWLFYTKSSFITLFFLALKGPFGLFTLFKSEVFYPLVDINRKTGQIIPDKYHKVKPMIVRIKQCFEGIRKSRADFQARPDKGLFGKNLTRLWNYFQNYFVRLVIWLLLIHCLMLPILILANTVVCTILALTSILWMACYIVIYYLFNIFIFRTFDRTHHTFSPFYWLLLVALASLLKLVYFLVTFCLHPLQAFIYFMWIQWVVRFRRAYEQVVIYLLRRFARTPAIDSIAAKRIGGPGISQGYFSSISQADLMITYIAELQRNKLNYLERTTNQRLMALPAGIQAFLRDLLKPFSASFSTSLIYHQTNKLVQMLKKQIDLEREKLPTGPRSAIRFGQEKLQIYLLKTQDILQKFVRHRPYFYESRELSIGASQALNLRIWEELFGASVLQPIEQAQMRIQLKAIRQPYFQQLTDSLYGEFNLTSTKYTHLLKNKANQKSPLLFVVARLQGRVFNSSSDSSWPERLVLNWNIQEVQAEREQQLQQQVEQRKKEFRPVS